MYFKNSSKPVFSFQVALLNGCFVNKLKIMEPVNKTKFFFFFLSFSLMSSPLCPSFFFFFSFLFSLLKLNSIILLCNHHLKKKKTNTRIKDIIMFFHILKYVIWNMIPNTFFALWILKTRIFTTFFKPQFSHRYLNTLT